MSNTSRGPKNILVRAPNWIGDQVIALPFFYYLRRSFPEARIVSACVPWVESIQFRNFVDEVIVLPRGPKKGWWARLELLEKTAEIMRRNGPWDLAIALPNSFSSAWELFRSGAKERWGYAADSRGILLNRKVDWRTGTALHRGDAYLRLLPGARRTADAILPVSEFWGIPPENELDEGIPGALSHFDASAAWPHAEPLDPPAQGFWVLAPGSAAESRRWPVERFLALARRIAGETGWLGVVVGGPAEAPLAEILCQELRAEGIKMLDRTARGSVSALWRIFGEAKFTVANDSGLAHVAALCGSPVVIVWGAGNPKRTRPLGPGTIQIVLNAVDCWPCERNKCLRLGGEGGIRLECLKGISVEEVWNEIQNGILRPEKGGRKREHLEEGTRD